MAINESLKKTIDDLDIDRRVEDLNKLAQRAIGEVKSSVGSLAVENRDKVDEWVAKATDAVDARTDGKYHDKMQKFSSAVGQAVDKVAVSTTPAADTPGGPSEQAWPGDDEAVGGTPFEPQFPMSSEAPGAGGAPGDLSGDAWSSATDHQAPFGAGSAAGEGMPRPVDSPDDAIGDAEGLGWPDQHGRTR